MTEEPKKPKTNEGVERQIDSKKIEDFKKKIIEKVGDKGYDFLSIPEVKKMLQEVDVKDEEHDKYLSELISDNVLYHVSPLRKCALSRASFFEVFYDDGFIVHNNNIELIELQRINMFDGNKPGDFLKSNFIDQLFNLTKYSPVDLSTYEGVRKLFAANEKFIEPDFQNKFIDFLREKKGKELSELGLFKYDDEDIVVDGITVFKKGGIYIIKNVYPVVYIISGDYDVEDRFKQIEKNDIVGFLNLLKELGQASAQPNPESPTPPNAPEQPVVVPDKREEQGQVAPPVTTPPLPPSPIEPVSEKLDKLKNKIWNKIKRLGYIYVYRTLDILKKDQVEADEDEVVKALDLLVGEGVLVKSEYFDGKYYLKGDGDCIKSAKLYFLKEFMKRNGLVNLFKEEKINIFNILSNSSLVEIERLFNKLKQQGKITQNSFEENMNNFHVVTFPDRSLSDDILDAYRFIDKETGKSILNAGILPLSKKYIDFLIEITENFQLDYIADILNHQEGSLSRQFLPVDVIPGVDKIQTRPTVSATPEQPVSAPVEPAPAQPQVDAPKVPPQLAPDTQPQTPSVDGGGVVKGTENEAVESLDIITRGFGEYLDEIFEKGKLGRNYKQTFLDFLKDKKIKYSYTERDEELVINHLVEIGLAEEVQSYILCNNNQVFFPGDVISKKTLSKAEERGYGRYNVLEKFLVDFIKSKPELSLKYEDIFYGVIPSLKNDINASKFMCFLDKSLIDKVLGDLVSEGVLIKAEEDIFDEHENIVIKNGRHYRKDYFKVQKDKAEAVDRDKQPEPEPLPGSNPDGDVDNPEDVSDKGLDALRDEYADLLSRHKKRKSKLAGILSLIRKKGANVAQPEVTDEVLKKAENAYKEKVKGEIVEILEKNQDKEEVVTLKGGSYVKAETGTSFSEKTPGVLRINKAVLSFVEGETEKLFKAEERFGQGESNKALKILKKAVGKYREWEADGKYRKYVKWIIPGLLVATGGYIFAGFTIAGAVGAGTTRIARSTLSGLVSPVVGKAVHSGFTGSYERKYKRDLTEAVGKMDSGKLDELQKQVEDRYKKRKLHQKLTKFATIGSILLVGGAMNIGANALFAGSGPSISGAKEVTDKIGGGGSGPTGGTGQTGPTGGTGGTGSTSPTGPTGGIKPTVPLTNSEKTVVSVGDLEKIKTVEGIRVSSNGSIETIKELKALLNDKVNTSVPDNIKGLFNDTPESITRKLGLWKPGADQESALLMDGDSIVVKENGIVAIKKANGDTPVILIDSKGNIHPYYEGNKMFHSQMPEKVQVKQFDATKFLEQKKPDPQVLIIDPDDVPTVFEVESAEISPGEYAIIEHKKSPFNNDLDTIPKYNTDSGINTVVKDVVEQGPGERVVPIDDYEENGYIKYNEVGGVKSILNANSNDISNFVTNRDGAHIELKDEYQFGSSPSDIESRLTYNKAITKLSTKGQFSTDYKINLPYKKYNNSFFNISVDESKKMRVSLNGKPLAETVGIDKKGKLVMDFNKDLPKKTSWFLGRKTEWYKAFEEFRDNVVKKENGVYKVGSVTLPGVPKK